MRKLYTVRIFYPCIVSTDYIREVGRHFRESSAEELPSLDDLCVEFFPEKETGRWPGRRPQKRGHLVGGIGCSISNVVHTQGWITAIRRLRTPRAL